MNEIVLHSRYDFIPASTRIEDLIEEIYACPGCAPAVVSSANLTGPPSEAEAPHTDQAKTELATEVAPWLATFRNNAVAIERAKMTSIVAHVARSQASPSMLSYIAVSKFCDHLPLYRLEEMFARQGANIPRSTMCGWLAALAALLRPLYDLMHSKLLLCKIIWTVFGKLNCSQCGNRKCCHLSS